MGCGQSNTKNSIKKIQVESPKKRKRPIKLIKPPQNSLKNIKILKDQKIKENFFKENFVSESENSDFEESFYDPVVINPKRVETDESNFSHLSKINSLFDESEIDFFDKKSSKGSLAKKRKISKFKGKLEKLEILENEILVENSLKSHNSSFLSSSSEDTNNKSFIRNILIDEDDIEYRSFIDENNERRTAKTIKSKGIILRSPKKRKTVVNFNQKNSSQNSSSYKKIAYIGIQTRKSLIISGHRPSLTPTKSTNIEDITPKVGKKIDQNIKKTARYNLMRLASMPLNSINDSIEYKEELKQPKKVEFEGRGRRKAKTFFEVKTPIRKRDCSIGDELSAQKGEYRSRQDLGNIIRSRETLRIFHRMRKPVSSITKKG